MKDYSSRVGTACIILILMLCGMGYIPALNIGGVELKRIDILSDLRPTTIEEDIFSRGDVSPVELNEAEYEIDMEELHASLSQVSELLAQREPTPQEQPQEEQEQEPQAEDTESRPSLSPILEGVELTPIENFDTTATNPFRRLYAKLNNPNVPIRIAIMGDSFVEGDILSCDLREVLQERYGGCGAGFAPFDSPLMRFRRTVKTTSSGWTTYNIMQKRTTPEELAPHYCVSGWVSQPDKGATTRWEGSSARRFLTTWSTSRLLFISRENSTMEVVINDTITKRHTFQGAEMVQQLLIPHDSTSSLEVRLTSGERGFVGYGAIFEGGNEGGVVVDNYSTRSSNGQNILWTNPAVNFQVNYAVGGYDLVILQYGLNIMQRGVKDYTRYSRQMEKIVAYVRECFPSAAVLIMGVSDRSLKEGGVYRPMGEAVQLSRYQRQAAENTHSAFWNTYDAMQAQGGMSRFVKQGWAGKDFTHINFAGGRQVAYALVDALVYDCQRFYPTIKRHNFEAVVPPHARQVTLDYK